MPETVTRPEQDGIPVLHDVDVVVIGAGPGGIGAAVSAARLGARTLLCEQYGFPGGMATAGLVNPFMPNHLDGRSLDSGVFQDWCRLMDDMGGLGENGRTFCHETAKLAAERLCLEAGVELLYHVRLDRPLMEGRRIACALMLGKGGLTAHRGALFVDCTGDGDLAARAGCAFDYGRPEDGLAQAMTTCFDLGGVDVERMCDRPTINAAYDRAREEGRIDCPRENVLYFPTLQADRIHFNTTRVIRHDATDTLSLSDAEVEGRRQVTEYLDFLRRDVPGFESARLHAIAVNIGVRESRHIRCRDRITREDFEQASKFPDGICRCRYPIDVHSPTGGGGESTDMPEGEWYDIPYGCLVPVDCDNLLVGGRPIGADHAIHASMRVMPPACTVGQAAGTAAAMAVRRGVPPGEIDGREVRRSLIEQGVWLAD
jgi:hypothetical protein